MFKLSVKEILEATRGKLVAKSGQKFFSGVSTDTRTIKKGDLFIALKGENFDGHDFLDEAAKKGAAGTIVEPKTLNLKPKTNLIQVKDTLKAYGDIAYYYRKKFEIPFIGITGSNGKTTAKEMAYKALSSRFGVLKTEGTENNLVGLPRTLLRLNDKHQLAILELGTNRFGEIGRLSEILKPTVGIITNIGPSHLEFLRSLDGVLKEKRELIDSLKRNGTAILNADDPFLSKVKRLKCRSVRFGVKNDCDYKATRIRKENDGIGFTVNDKYNFKIRLLGMHNIYNALVAIAVGFLHKVDFDDIYKALIEFEPQNGRLCLKRICDIDVIDDTYNANPWSLNSAVGVLSSYKSVGRKIFVCGDMLELGEHAPKFHSEAAKLISQARFDYFINVGNFSELMKEEAVSSGMAQGRVFACKYSREALDILKKILNENDVVLLKGSRRVRLDEVVNALPSFISVKRDMVRV